MRRKGELHETAQHRVVGDDRDGHHVTFGITSDVVIHDDIALGEERCGEEDGEESEKAHRAGLF